MRFRDRESLLEAVRNHGVEIGVGHHIGLLQSLLHVHAELNVVQKELQLRLPLRIAARRPEHHQRFRHPS